MLILDWSCWSAGLTVNAGWTSEMRITWEVCNLGFPPNKEFKKACLQAGIDATKI